VRIAEALRAEGIDVWFDKWQILPGDSLIQKIFEEGLSRADAFIVLLSEQSVNSRWVQQELDAALLKRIEGVTRVIPVRISEVEIPTALRPLLWVDMTRDFDAALRELQRAVFQVYERPPIGQPPDFVTDALVSVAGLSRLGTALGMFLVKTGRNDIGIEEAFSEAHLAEKLGFTPEEADDAVDELEGLGLVKTRNYFGTAPFSHGDIEPTYALFLHFRGQGLDYDPEEDIRSIASAVAAQKQVDGSTLAQLTDLPPLRINRAVDYLEDYGILKVLRTLGTAPFSFNTVYATGATRRFVAESSK
jgi:hypothetical protein